MEKINESPKLESAEQIDMDKLRRAVSDWGHGKLEEALELYDDYGLAAFRKLPEKYWEIKKDLIEVFRAVKKQEIENGPTMLGGRDPEKRIQRLTSWSRKSDFAKKWAGGNETVLSMKADQNDIAFFPLRSPHRNEEEEVVIADYHLKKEKISNFEEDEREED